MKPLDHLLTQSQLKSGSGGRNRNTKGKVRRGEGRSETGSYWFLR